MDRPLRSSTSPNLITSLVKTKRTTFDKALDVCVFIYIKIKQE